MHQHVVVHLEYSPRPDGRIARVSSRCASGHCVGVVPLADGVEIIDTKVGDGPALRFTRDEWAAFLAGVKNDEFDLDRLA